MLALVALNRAPRPLPAPPVEREKSFGGTRVGIESHGRLTPTRGTLIIAPVTLLGQWKRELESRFAGNMNVYVYHTNRKRDVAHLAKYDVGLTSFSIVRAECRRPTKPLHDIYWHRVVLDESHYIKALGKNMLLAEVCSLQTRYRWCVTGTPVTTSLNDILQQARFLRMPIVTRISLRSSCVTRFCSLSGSVVSLSYSSTLLLSWSSISAFEKGPLSGNYSS